MGSTQAQLSGEITELQEWHVERTLSGLPPDELTGIRSLLEAALHGDQEAALDALSEVSDDLRSLWRAGRGRGKRREAGNTVIVGTKVKPSLRRLIELVAEEQDLTVSAWARRAVRRAAVEDSTTESTPATDEVVS